MKKLLCINGSARPNGNTHLALEILTEALVPYGIHTEIVDLAKVELNPCMACGKCKGNNACIQNDAINELYNNAKLCDGIVLASPTYFSNVTSRMAMFIERMGYVARANGNAFAGKVGASIAVARRAGVNMVYSILNFFFGLAQMPIATSTYWNVLLGRAPGDINDDEEGLETLNNLAESISKLVK